MPAGRVVPAPGAYYDEDTMITMTHQRIAAVVLLTVVTSFLSVATLRAHMKFAKSAPAADSTIAAPPSGIQVWFTQKPDVKVSKIELTGPAGPVKLDTLHAMKDNSLMAAVADKMSEKLSDGAYTVAWQAAGDDGHIQKGGFKFTLKRAAH
jgi:methionine-rich copper-binding protein CopC